MKLFGPLLLSSVLCMASSATLDCETSIERATSDSLDVCAHFEGANADGYRQWYGDNNIGAKYPNNVFLLGSDPTQPENGAAVHWNVDDNYVYLAVAAQATGWVGFGIGDAGGMLGADMALFTAVRPTEIVDAYTQDNRMPIVDECSADWELLASNIDDENDFIMFEMKRLLDTGDHQDRRIMNDSSTLMPPHRIIAAWGDTTEVGYHGLNRARGSIRFYGSGDEETIFHQTMKAQSEGSFMVKSSNHKIAQNETEYAYTCISRQGLIDEGVPDTLEKINMIGFEPFIQEGHEAYVHHYIVYGSEQSNCDADFDEPIYVWAPGEAPLTLPETLGAPLFGDDGFQAFEIEVHYNNPHLTPDIIDSSGVRIYWTSEPREEEVGVLSIGDPLVYLEGLPIGDGSTVHSFECPGTCSSLVNREVHVLREYLHAHRTGARLMNEQIRDGEVIRTGSLDYWEFDQSGNAAVQQDAFDVLPGDGFRTTCYYQGSDKVFGWGSSEEMCMAFLLYHPRVKLSIPGFSQTFPWYCGYDIGFAACETSYETRTLSGAVDFGRTFGAGDSDKCPAPDDDGGNSVGDDEPSADDENGGVPRSFVSVAVGLVATALAIERL